jgi:hypothetical protein
MPAWIIAAALGSIAITALLTFILWRMNAPMLRERAGNQDGGDGAFVPAHRSDNDGDGGGSSSGGGGGE